jgi:hypothetical protein
MKRWPTCDFRFSISGSACLGCRAQTQSQIDLRSRRGVAELVSTLLALPLLLLMIAMILYFGRALYAKAAVEDTASVGARWAATSLSGEQGCRQSRQALTTVLQGYYLDPAGAHVTVRPVGAWGRGARAEVQVTYKVSQRGVPILGRLLGDSVVRSRYLVPIDPFNNRYDDAWQVCL